MTTPPQGRSGYGSPVAQTGASPEESVAATDDRSIGEIVGDVASNLTDLMRQELDLARTEFKEEATRVGKGAGMLGAAGVAGHLALLLGSLALVYLLDNWMPVELAALIVAAVWAVVTAVLALRGRRELKQANPELPTTQRTLKEDVRWAKAQKS